MGTISNDKHKQEVVAIFKQGSVIILKLKEDTKFEVGDEVQQEADKERRTQLAQHHTATHIINAAAKKVLGNHINQAGAKKNVDKAHIDITHYQSVTEEEVKAIEKEANKIVNEDINLHLRFEDRDAAEKKFGMEIYQGGAVPGKRLRIVEIPEVDVEACGGTHLLSTKEAVAIKIIKSTKVQDGVVRLVFTAGNAAQEAEASTGNVLKTLATELSCNENQIPSRAKELFVLWKNVIKKKKDMPKELTSKDVFDGDVLAKVCEVLKTQPEHVIKTIRRFKKELNL